MKAAGIKIKESIFSFTKYSLTFLAVLLLLRFIEISYSCYLHGYPSSFIKLLGFAVLFDLFFWLKTSLLLMILFVPLYLVSKRTAKVSYVILTLLICVIHLALVQYFNQSMVPLGADLYGYKLADIKQTVGAAGGVKVYFIFVLLITIAILVWLFRWLPNKVKAGHSISFAFVSLCIILFFFNTSFVVSTSGFKTEFENNEAINKTDFFFSKSYNHFFPQQVETDIYADSYIGDYGDAAARVAAFEYIDEENYPFLHQDNTPDVLTPFFNKAVTPPNIVILLVEGLGRAFTNEGAYLGNFTPFLDSLSKHSLYWENFLSEGGRTFAVLPSLLGSLPFAKNGFVEMGEKMPDHLSLLSLLKLNGYNTSFYYGGESKFDNMEIFLKKNKIDELNDLKTFSHGYIQMPSNNGFTWGYGDKELFRRYFETRTDNQTKPQLSVILTVSTHSPFAINEQEKYNQRLEDRMNEIGITEARKTEYRNYQRQYASILYTDDALKNFISNYSKRNDFNNTIFLITGDHRMPEIPMTSKIDRYHVPFIIYSPLLARTAKFSSVSTHFDVAPSLLAFIKTNYNIKTPSLVSWIGNGIDTSRSLQNNHAYPLMQTKNDMIDFVMNNYLLNGETTYMLGQNLSTATFEDKDKNTQLKAEFEKFKSRNSAIINGGKIIPDSIYQEYYPH